MRLPRKWLFALAVSAAVPQAGWAEQAPTQTPSQTSTQTQSIESQARPNAAIAQDIASSLKSAGLTGRNIQIKVKNGTAVLGGQIGDASQKATVTRLAAAVAGVRAVQNDMTPMDAAAPAAPVSGVQTAALSESTPASAVRPVAHSQERPTAAPAKVAKAEAIAPQTLPPMPAQPIETASTGRTNQQVAQDIAGALSQAGLNKYDLEIRFKNGICSLIGGVGSPQEAAQADYLCRNIDGVQSVNNQLTVNGRLASAYAPAQAQGVQPVAGQAPQMPQGYGGQPIQTAQMMAPMGAPQMGMPAPMGGPSAYGPQGGAIQPVGHHGNPGVYNRPTLPEHAWPSYAAYDNYAAVTYPGQYDASAFPYIGPFYPYPQVPMGWRKAQLEWDDGVWNLDFDSRTDKWFWFVNPANWH